MFSKIEEIGPSLGVQNYGVSLNKLEQVFLKVGEMTGTVDRSEEVQAALKELIHENDNRMQGPVKVMNQMGNILLKSLHYDIVCCCLLRDSRGTELHPGSTYPLVALINDISGHAGLWLGMSVVSVVEVIALFFMCI
ncbi:hypothetical protein PENTCL1PPCAC_17334, partial [Pristionchus entomophagus]